MKKYALRILVALSLWTIVGYMVIVIDPDILKNVLIEGAYLPFMACLMCALWYTSALIFSSWWRGLLISLTIIIQIGLRLMGILTILVIVISAVSIFCLLWISYQRNGRVKDKNTSNTESEGNL
ncbi:MAG: hypothetical protein WCL07_03155 [bacterium]